MSRSGCHLRDEVATVGHDRLALRRPILSRIAEVAVRVGRNDVPRVVGVPALDVPTRRDVDCDLDVGVRLGPGRVTDRHLVPGWLRQRGRRRRTDKDGTPCQYENDAGSERRRAYPSPAPYHCAPPSHAQTTVTWDVEAVTGAGSRPFRGRTGVGLPGTIASRHARLGHTAHWIRPDASPPTSRIRRLGRDA